MTVTPAMIDDLMHRSEAVVRTLVGDPVVGRYVDGPRPLPRPFQGTGEVRLVILGQDPTVERGESRDRVTTVLNLDRGGSLRTLLAGTVCAGLRARAVARDGASWMGSVGRRLGTPYSFLKVTSSSRVR